MKEFNFTLGVVEKLNIKMESVVAQDINCNKFNIQLVHDASMQPYDLTGATSAIVYFLRSDNLVFQEYATITNHTQGRLEIILATDTFAVSGVAVAEVAVYAGEEMKCTSQTFKFNIRKPLNDGDVYVSGNDLPNYKAELARLETILENLIITAGDSNPEIVAARYSIADGIDYSTIGDRMDAIDTKIENIEVDLTPIENEIADLAGAGRTTETVKQNADDIANFRSDYLSHVADVVTDANGVHGLKIEKGTFTPTIYCSSVAGSNTYTRNIGHYIKIGDFVQVSAIITMSLKDANMAGTLGIDGLPFPVANASNLYNTPSLYTSNIDFGVGKTQISGYFEQNRSRIILVTSGSSVIAGTLNQSHLANNTEIVFTATYRTV